MRPKAGYDLRMDSGENMIHVISEAAPLARRPEGTVRILVTAELETIRQRFRVRRHGSPTVPAERTPEGKHGMFDGGHYASRFDGTSGNAKEFRAAPARLGKEKGVG